MPNTIEKSNIQVNRGCDKIIHTKSIQEKVLIKLAKRTQSSYDTINSKS